MALSVAAAESAAQAGGRAPYLEVKQLTKSFGGLNAVSDLNFHVFQHEIFSIIGPNGAGKTTVFNLITGLYQPNGVLQGKGNRIGTAVRLVGGRLGLVLRRRPQHFLRWVISTLAGMALGVLFCVFFLNVLIDSAITDETYLFNAVLLTVVIWLVFWPLYSFVQEFVSPARGFWANLDVQEKGLSGYVGDVRLDGSTLLGVTPDVVLARGVARTYQNIRLFNNMTVLENVLVGQHARLRAGILGAVLRPPRVRREEEAAREKAIELLGFFGTELMDRKDEIVSNLSYAQKRRVEICRALASDPKVLLLDEPTAGMNDAETGDAVTYIRRLRDERHLTILLIEHKLTVTMGISDRIAVLDYGRKIAEGLPDEVRNNELVIEAYLGRKTTVADNG
ncbi:MAG TPA: ATP-binding cassette domain-containing protein [Ktedonobacterales bacterium]|nr:ATP-binding cassette domain-containing protein [Ktedonobacterales bacterium]